MRLSCPTFRFLILCLQVALVSCLILRNTEAENPYQISSRITVVPLQKYCDRNVILHRASLSNHIITHTSQLKMCGEQTIFHLQPKGTTQASADQFYFLIVTSAP
jgi:N6-adenosine-specific RNA methylase IME4